MRALKLAFAFLLTVLLTAPPVTFAGQGPGRGQDKEKVEKPQKAQKQQKAKRGAPQRAQKAQKSTRAPKRAQKAQKVKRAPQKVREAPKRAQKAPKTQKAQKAQRERVRRAPQRSQRAERDVRQTRETREVRELRERREADRRVARRAPTRERIVRDVRPGNGDMRFRGQDRNGDRRITRAEWRGNDVSFANHDWNGDGILSGDEVIPGARRDARRDDRIVRDRTDRDRYIVRDLDDGPRWIGVDGLDRLGRLDRLAREDRLIRQIREEHLERENRLLRDRFGDRSVRTARWGATDLRFFRDGYGRRIALAPAPLTTRIDRYYEVTRSYDPYGASSPDLVRIDFGLDFDDRNDGLLDAFALPLALLVTNALIDDVDQFVGVERFATYDRDYDGYLTEAEWPGGDRSFGRYDLDGDGYLLERELYSDTDSVVIDRDRLFYFQGLDRDDDGLVAPWEWPGDLDSFWFRDYNADGAVSLDEYLGLEVDRPVRDLEFDAIDYDRDGEIARVEWVGAPYRFQRLDRNDNGVVGRWEYAFGWLRGA